MSVYIYDVKSFSSRTEMQPVGLTNLAATDESIVAESIPCSIRLCFWSLYDTKLRNRLSVDDILKIIDNVE